MDSIEEERVEALRDWWRANSRTLLAGIGLIVVGVVGIQSWQKLESNKAGAASALYNELQTAIQSEQLEQAVRAGDQLLTQYGGTAYGPVTALLMARLAAERDDDATETHLNWVIDNSSDPALTTLAQLRLARWQLARGELETSRELLDQIPESARSASWSELEGDLLAAQGNLDGARAAYRRTLASGGRIRLGSFDLNQMKLDDLGLSAEETPNAN
ncbi:MAG: tetratricopeptide repeat protein [Gammaproteobacteria bacterium]|nr:tetratricopeptide repeat protein [Gammaproteobacteria bacterium]